jgi:hypothetical protein
MGKFKQSILLFMLCSFAAIAQNKTIVPTSGAIVFSCKSIIHDQGLYDKSKKEFSKALVNSLKEEIVIEQQLKGLVVDTVKINQHFKNNGHAITQLFESEVLNKSDYTIHHEFKDSIATKHETRNGSATSFLEINTKTRIFKNEFTEDYYDYSDNTIIDITEFKKETKTIHNYKCFKVIYTYREADVSDFSTLMSNYKTTREMWVTDKIKTNLHPIVNDREIISKYYPLEITETSEMSKGKTTHYKIESCTLK